MRICIMPRWRPISMYLVFPCLLLKKYPYKYLIAHLHFFLLFWYHRLLLLLIWRPISMYLVFPCWLLNHLITHRHLYPLLWCHRLLLPVVICSFVTTPQWCPTSIYLVFPFLLLNQVPYNYLITHLPIQSKIPIKTKISQK